jgi:hypothetical protein
MFCVAGFRPGRRGIAWRVPKGATIVVEQKAPKPVTPRLAIGGMDRIRRADQLADLRRAQTRPARFMRASDPNNRTAGVGPWKTNLSGTHMKEGGAIYSL